MTFNYKLCEGQKVKCNQQVWRNDQKTAFTEKYKISRKEKTKKKKVKTKKKKKTN